MGSTRLPGKVMKKIKGKTILFYIVERLRKSKLIDIIVIATSTNQIDNVIFEEAERLNVDCFRGSEDDVLLRYYNAAQKYTAENVIRITGDCPLIDPKLIDEIIGFYLENNDLDLITNAGPITEKRTFPRGLDVEVFSYDALKMAYENAKDDYQREHVTPYIYENSDKLKIYYYTAEGKLNRPDIRITLDTTEDFKFISKIIENFKNINFSSEEIVDFLEKNPDLLKINQHVKQKKIRKDV
jgi:spore coat polysaccharide biosynthesis protein SpsF